MQQLLKVFLALNLIAFSLGQWTYTKPQSLCANNPQNGSPIELDPEQYCGGDQEIWRDFNLYFNEISTATLQRNGPEAEYLSWKPLNVDRGTMRLRAQALDYSTNNFYLDHLEARVPAEHIYNQTDTNTVEIQLYFKLDETQQNKGKKNTAVVSYIFQVHTETWGLKYDYTDLLDAFDPKSQTIPNFNFKQKFRLIDDNLENMFQIGYYHYLGSATHPPSADSTACDEDILWFVYQQPIAVKRETIVQFFVSQYGPEYQPTFKGTAQPVVDLGDRDLIVVGCAPTTEFFETQIRSNAGLWWYWWFVLTYFIIAIACDKNWNEETAGKHQASQRRENNWTIHPFYSIYKSGYDTYFPKTVRVTQLFLSYVCYGVVIAGFYYYWKRNYPQPDVDQGTIVAATAMISVLITDPILFILGVYISGIYPLIISKYQKEYDQKKEKDPDQKEIIRVQIQDIQSSIYSKYFFFYLFSFILAVASITMTIIMLGQLESDQYSGKWIGSVIIAILFENCVFDFVAVFFSQYCTFLRRKGYYYDFRLEEAFHQSEKDD